ncbi:MAG: hypothetical protein U9R72_12460, partial [Chloroflexota bacterium]|nr:hypothetical protein [Chloroflexota bacterium]
MSERVEMRHSSGIEEALGTLFSAPEPDSAFVDRLERQLMAQHEAVATQPAGQASSLRRFWDLIWQPLTQHHWATVGIAVLLALAVAFLAIGPQRVWADLQRLLGYVPGVGFVNLDETRVLTAPVIVTRDGVTLRVEQVLAQRDRTTVVVSSDGLPPEDEVWPQGPEAEALSQPRLRLPDGRTLAPETFTLRWGAGTLEFPPLPADVHRFTLELPRLPLVPADVAPEDWAIPLMLRPTTGELVAALFPEPYAPPDASDAHQDVTLRVLAVAQGAEETAVKLQLQWLNPDWETHFIFGYQGPNLRDDLGHVYMEASSSESGSTSQSVVVAVQPESDVTRSATPSVPTIERTMTFAPVSPSAGRLTFTMGELAFEVPAKGGFTVNLGDDPQVGDTWPLDIDLDVAGLPVHINGARLTEEELGRPEEISHRTVLEFTLDPAVGEDVALSGVRLDGEAAGFQGGSLGGYDPQSNRVRAGLVAEAGEPIPNGTIKLRITGARIHLRDTWTMTWEVPGTGDETPGRRRPLALHPTEAQETRNGLTLAVQEVVLTDRLTGVQVGLEDAPPSTTLAGGLRWSGPSVSVRGLRLEDDRGGRYELPRSVYWGPYNEPEPDLTAFGFEAVQPLARRLTLHVPAVAVTHPASAAFDITVPKGLEMEAGTYDTPWLASASWEVDIPLEVAGYRLHFSEARLEDLNGTTLLRLLSEPYEPGQNEQLYGLHLASVRAPDGRPVDLRSALSAAGPQEEDSDAHRARLWFDVLDPETVTVGAGRYHVEIDGVTVLYQGPWELSWELPGPRRVRRSPHDPAAWRRDHCAVHTS